MKDRQHNGQKKNNKGRNNDLQNGTQDGRHKLTHKAKDLATRTQLKRNVNYGAPVG